MAMTLILLWLQLSVLAYSQYWPTDWLGYGKKKSHVNYTAMVNQQVFEQKQHEFRDFVYNFITTQSKLGYLKSDYPIWPHQTFRNCSYHTQPPKKPISVNLFIFGDSVNRNMIRDFCDHHNGTIYQWGKGVFAYRVGASPSQLCRVGNITIAMLHLYGSQPTGPYHKNHHNTKDDPYADTKLRIPHGIEEYSLHYGIPNFVLYRTELWDICIQPSILSSIQHNYQVNLAQIHTLLPASWVGTHTTPAVAGGSIEAHTIAIESIRNVSSSASSPNLPWMYLVDWYDMMQKGGYEQTEYLVDNFHPNPLHSKHFITMTIHLMQSWLQTQCTV